VSNLVELDVLIAGINSHNRAVRRGDRDAADLMVTS
jgi:hypothetical protein